MAPPLAHSTLTNMKMSAATADVETVENQKVSVSTNAQFYAQRPTCKQRGPHVSSPLTLLLPLSALK